MKMPSKPIIPVEEPWARELITGLATGIVVFAVSALAVLAVLRFESPAAAFLVFVIGLTIGLPVVHFLFADNLEGGNDNGGYVLFSIGFFVGLIIVGGFIAGIVLSGVVNSIAP